MIKLFQEEQLIYANNLINGVVSLGRFLSLSFWGLDTGGVGSNVSQ